MASSSESTARRPVAISVRVCVLDIVRFVNVRVALAPIYGYKRYRDVFGSAVYVVTLFTRVTGRRV